MRRVGISAGLAALALFGLVLGAHGAEPWTKTLPTEAPATGWDLLPADGGGWYVLGNSYTSYEPVMQSDIALFRIDRDGSVLWQRTHDVSFQDEAWSMVEAGGGAILIAGSTTLGDAGLEILLLTVDSDGELLGMRTLGSAVDDIAIDIVAMDDGGFLVVGDLVDPDDFVAYSDDPGYGGFEGRSQPFALRLDAQGEVAWHRVYDIGGNVLVNSVACTPGGGAVFLATEMFYPTRDDNDIWLVRIDAEGEIVWQLAVTEGRATGYDVIERADGTYVAAGSMARIGTSGQVVDGIFLQVDLDGTILWENTYGDPAAIDFGAEIVECADGRLLAIGGAAEVPVLELTSAGGCEGIHTVHVGCHTLFGELLLHPEGGFIGVGGLLCWPESKILVVRFDEDGRAPSL